MGKEKSRQELETLKQEFRSTVEFWIKSLNESDKSDLAQINAAKVEHPKAEVEKLVKLIKAHTTKVGIIFKPENLKNDDVSPAFTTLESLVHSSSLLITVYCQLKGIAIAQLFYNEIGYALTQLYSSIIGLLDELSVEYVAESELVEKESDGRLISVGIVWSNCDNLVKLLQLGELGVLTTKIVENTTLIEDGFEDFVEWAENPEQFDDDDPFGLELSDSEDEDDDEEIPKTEVNPPTEDDEDDGGQKEELIKFAKKWVKQIELIKLLVSSFKKSLPNSTTSATIDDIYAVQRTLVGLIDKLIADLMMDQVIDEEIEQYTKAITTQGMKLSKIARTCHKSNEKKAKWYEAWDKKYNDGLNA
jgi:hypothetical protein